MTNEPTNGPAPSPSELLASWANLGRYRVDRATQLSESDEAEESLFLNAPSTFADHVIAFAHMTEPPQSISPEDLCRALDYLGSRIGLLIWLERAPAGKRLALADALLPMLKIWFISSSCSEELFMFWDGVLGPRPHDTQPAHHAIAESIFNSLAEMLANDSLPSKWSALHGFNHLRDARCMTLIEQAMTDPTLPTDIREYASAAAKFELM